MYFLGNTIYTDYRKVVSLFFGVNMAEKIINSESNKIMF